MRKSRSDSPVVELPATETKEEPRVMTATRVDNVEVTFDDDINLAIGYKKKSGFITLFFNGEERVLTRAELLTFTTALDLAYEEIQT